MPIATLPTLSARRTGSAGGAVASLSGDGPSCVSPPRGFTIDCTDCDYQHTSVCDDCVVTFIVDREPDDAVVIDAAEARAVRLLEQAGLVPGVRHSRHAG